LHKESARSNEAHLCILRAWKKLNALGRCLSIFYADGPADPIPEVTLHPDGSIVEMVIWQLPSPTEDRPHALKYRLFYGRDGERIVGYDNERGKGDHKHLLDVEKRYKFTSVEKLVADFLADVERTKNA